MEHASEPPESDTPITGSALDEVTHYLRHVCPEADERCQPISDEDARVIATMLAPLTGPGSAMATLAENGQADPLALAAECQQLTGRTWRTPEIAQWLLHLQTRLGTPCSGDPPNPGTSPQVEQGLAEHGDAFRAYLSLPDVDESADDVLSTFSEFYIGTYPNIDVLLDELTEVRTWEAAIDELATRHGIEDLVSLNRAKVEYIARQTWDIIQIGEHLYVFAM